jgi:hypothetical protein
VRSALMGTSRSRVTEFRSAHPKSARLRSISAFTISASAPMLSLNAASSGCMTPLITSLPFQRSRSQRISSQLSESRPARKPLLSMSVILTPTCSPRLERRQSIGGGQVDTCCPFFGANLIFHRCYFDARRVHHISCVVALASTDGLSTPRGVLPAAKSMNDCAAIRATRSRLSCVTPAVWGLANTFGSVRSG